MSGRDRSDDGQNSQGNPTTSVTLVVVGLAVPKGLPLAVTLALPFAARREWNAGRGLLSGSVGSLNFVVRSYFITGTLYFMYPEPIYLLEFS